MKKNRINFVKYSFLFFFPHLGNLIKILFERKFKFIKICLLIIIIIYAFFYSFHPLILILISHLRKLIF